MDERLTLYGWLANDLREWCSQTMLLTHYVMLRALEKRNTEHWSTLKYNDKSIC